MARLQERNRRLLRHLPDRLEAMGRPAKSLFFLAVDGAWAALALLMALLLALSLAQDHPAVATDTGIAVATGGGAARGLAATLPLFAVMIPAACALSWILGLSRIRLKSYDAKAVQRTAVYALALSATGALGDALLGLGQGPALFLLFGLVLFSGFVLGRAGGLRLVRWIYGRRWPRRRVLIYGAGATGMQLAAALSTHDAIEAVAFVDDNPALRGLTVSGLPVHGAARVEELVRHKRIDRVLLAMPDLPRHKLSVLALKLQRAGVDVHSVPSFAQLAGEGALLDRMEPVLVEGLIGRATVMDDLVRVRQTFAGRVVMVTGAGGSIGSELCRQLAVCRPAALVLFDQSEPALYAIDRELQDLSGADGPKIVPRLGSVTDARSLRRVLVETGVSTILHTAAYKHVPMVEGNPLAGVQNNVIGTRVAAEAARDLKLDHFMLVSSDKAVRPRNVMGASKRLAELVVQDLATRAGGTCFSMVRFGNVLGSSGSVYPLFQDQIAKGGPVTLTHDEVTRYFMTIPEAARLVLTATTFARGGDLFVLDMGQPVPIRRLAERMIANAGLTVRGPDRPDGDIEIVVTGLRPGEKLHEELLIGADRLTTPHPKILRAQEAYLSEIEVANMLRDLTAVLEAADVPALKRVMARWIGDHAFDAAPASVTFLRREVTEGKESLRG